MERRFLGNALKIASQLCRCNTLTQPSRCQNLCRAVTRNVNQRITQSSSLHTTSRVFALVDDDGDPVPQGMKTTVSILNEETDAGIFMDSYSPMGFKLNNGIRVMGPCAVFPRSVLHWNVRNAESINEDTLSLFTVLEPKIDILILGVGERENISKVNPAIIQYLRSHKIGMEILATDQALALFNFLNAEKRYVAGAFIPPSFIEADEDQQFQSLWQGNQTPYEHDADRFFGPPDPTMYVDIPDAPKAFTEARKVLTEKIKKETQGTDTEPPKGDRD